MSPSPALIWCPFGDEASARECASILLKEGLVACANILPPITSLYVWKGEAAESKECGVLFKTNSERLELAIDRLGHIHPYEAPAILGWHADRSNTAAAEWLLGLGQSPER